MAHDTIYKGDTLIGERERRKVLLLAGLIEVAANEFSRLNSEVFSPACRREYAILSVLEKQYYKLTARKPDDELSLTTIQLVEPLYATRTLASIITLTADITKRARGDTPFLF